MERPGQEWKKPDTQVNQSGRQIRRYNEKTYVTEILVGKQGPQKAALHFYIAPVP